MLLNLNLYLIKELQCLVPSYLVNQKVSSFIDLLGASTYIAYLIDLSLATR